LQKGAMNDDGCDDDDDDRQEQLSSQAAVLQGMAFLLVMEILGNGSVDSQILHFAKLPSTHMHRHSSFPSPLSLVSKTGNYQVSCCSFASSLLLMCFEFRELSFCARFAFQTLQSSGRL